jgi:hypothetical protein
VENAGTTKAERDSRHGEWREKDNSGAKKRLAILFAYVALGHLQG